MVIARKHCGGNGNEPEHLIRRTRDDNRKGHLEDSGTGGKDSVPSRSCGRCLSAGSRDTGGLERDSLSALLLPRGCGTPDCPVGNPSGGTGSADSEKRAESQQQPGIGGTCPRGGLPCRPSCQQPCRRSRTRRRASDNGASSPERNPDRRSRPESGRGGPAAGFPRRRENHPDPELLRA